MVKITQFVPLLFWGHFMDKFKRTTQYLKDQMIPYMEIHNANSMTISDFCKYCNINRKTFYFHFESIDTLINELINDKKNHLKDCYENYLSIDNNLQISQMVHYFNLYMVEEYSFYKVVFGVPFNNYIFISISDYFCDILRPIFDESKFESEGELNIVIQGFVFALFSPYRYAYNHQIPFNDVSLQQMTLKAFNIHDYIKEQFACS